MANKPQVKDITKTGPLNWRELQSLNNGASESNPFAPDMRVVGMLQQALAPTRSLYDINANSPQGVYSSLYNPKTGDYWGNSHWDKNVATEEEFQHLSDARAENQPWYSKAVNGIGKGIVLAGTTFLDGTVGLVAGTVQGLNYLKDDDPNTGFWQSIWDNPVTQAMNDINKWSEEVMPNYYTEYQQNNPWSKENLLSANFLFDKVVKNMGFMVGAAYSGGVYSKAIGATARGIGGARALVAAKRAGMTAEGIDRAMRLGVQAAESSRASKAVKGTVGAFFNAQAEATVEAVSNSDDFVENMTQQLEERIMSRIQAAEEKYNENKGKLTPIYDVEGNVTGYVDNAFTEYQQEMAQIRQDRDAGLAEIEKARAGMGSADFLFNIPILWAGDMLTLFKFYAGGWKAARTEAKTATRATKEAMQSAEAAAKAGDRTALDKLNQIVKKAEQTGYQGLTAEERKLVEEVQTEYLLPKWAGYTKAAVKNPLKEAHEEMAQAAASRAAGLYYKNDLDYIFDSQTDPNAQRHVMSWLDAIWEGTKAQYGDVNNYEEALIGGLTGMLGSPTIGKKNNSTNQTWLGRDKVFGFSGGMVTDIRDYREGRESAEATAAHINKVLKDPNLENRLKHLVAQTKFADDKQQAIIHDDKMAYKDAETASIFEDIMYLKKGQRLDLLENAIKQMGMEYSDSEIQEIVELTSKQASAYDARIQDKVKRRNTLNSSLDALYQQREQLSQALEQASQDNSEQGMQKLESISQQLEQVRAQINQVSSELNTLDTYINNNSPVTLSPYIKPDGTAMTADEIREDLKEKAQRIQTIIDDVSQVQEEIDKSTGDAYTDEQLTTLTWYSVMMRDWDRRSNGILNEVRASLKMALDDPTTKALLEVLESVGDVEDSDGKPIFGGVPRNIRRWQKFQESILDRLSRIVTEVGDEKAGAALAMQLSDNTKVKVGDKETTYGENLLEALKASIKSNPAFQGNEAEMEYLGKQLDDLKKIGEARRKYNELLEEFRKHPEKITKAHQATQRKNERKKSKSVAEAILNNFNWKGKIGEIARTLQDQAQAIRDIGGFDKLLQEATPEQRKKLLAAQKFIDGVNHLKDDIRDADISDRIKGAVNQIIENHFEESDSFLELANSVRESSYEFDAANIPVEDMEDLPVVQELLDPANISEIAKKIDAIERDRQARFEEAVKKQAEALAKEEAIEEPSADKIPVEENEEPAADEVPDEVDADIKETTSEGESLAAQADKAAAKLNDKLNKDLGKEGRGGMENRRQISEAYLHEPSMTLYDFYNANRDRIPKGVDKEQFLTYIKETSEFLKNEGAFDYVHNGNLHQGDVITFGMDEELNKRAGTKVVLMYVTTADGKKQVVGSIRSSFEFAQYHAAGKKNVAVEAQEALYKAVTEGQQISTKVQSLFGGMLPITSTKLDNTLSAIFGENKPVLAVATTDGFTATLNNVEVLSNGERKNGQVYVLIPTVTGRYLPALCASKPLSELGTDSWYYQNVLIPDILKLLANPTMVNLTQARRSFSTRLHIQAGIYKGNKFVKINDGEKPTHYQVGLKSKDGDKKTALNVIVEIPTNGFTNDDVLDLIEKIVKGSQKQGITLTARLDIKRIRSGNDPEYAKHILETLSTNLMTGEKGQHSINDGFLYEPTDIEKGILEKGAAHTARKPKGTTGAAGSNIQVVKVDGVDLEVSSSGTVTRNGKVVTDEELAAQANAVTKAESAAATMVAPKESKAETGATPKEPNGLGGVANKRRGPRDSSVRLSFAGTQQHNSGIKRTFVASEEVTEPMSTAEQIQHAMEEVRRMFPALGQQGRVILVDGMLHTTDTNGNPVKAFGLFKDGVLYISSNSPLGTAYHEAFHYMTAFIMDDKQRARMFEIAREQFGNLEEIALEEKLAEKFREYVNGYEDKSLTGRIKSFFRTLKNLINSIRGRENYLDTLFYNIYKGDWAVQDTEDNYHQKLIEYKNKSLSYDNLAQEDREYLDARHVSKEDFDKMTVEQKELFLHCM